MNQSLRGFLLLTVLLSTLLCTPAFAQGEMSTPYTSRSLTLPEGTMMFLGGPASNMDYSGYLIDGGLNVIFFQDIEVCAPFVGCTDVEIDDPSFLYLGGAIGLTPELELGVMVLPLQLGPDAEYLNPSVWGKYKLLEGDFQVAAQAMLFLPIEGDDLGFDLGAAARLRGPVRVDTGAFVQIDTGGDAGLRLPATVTTNVTDSVFIGGRSGIFIPNFDTDDTYMPLELVAGYTLGAGNALVDLTVMTGFPFFLSFGGRSQYDEIVTEIFQLALGANVYFDVF